MAGGVEFLFSWGGGVVLALCLFVAVGFLWCKQRVPQQFAPVDVDEERVCKQGFTLKKVPENLDAIIIGAGIGGLTAGALLSREGKKVLVLEQHTMAGGNTHTFEEHGFEFDTGLHYVGGKVGSKSAPTRKFWDYITDNGVEWAKMEEVFDRAVLLPAGATSAKDRVEYPLNCNLDQMKRDFHQRFPEERDAIEGFFKMVAKAEPAFAFYVASRIVPKWCTSFLRCLFPKKFALFNLTMKDVLDDLTNNETLRGVLAYAYGDFGEPPERASFIVAAMILTHFIGGGYYPVGGPSVIPKHMIRVIEKYGGGRVFVRASVSSIVVEGGKAVGVVVKGKHTIRAPIVISSVGAPLTFNKLVPEHLRKEIFQEEIQGLKKEGVASTLSLMSMFVGVRGTSEELMLPRCNHWVFPSWDHDRALEAFRKDPVNEPIPAAFISFSSAKDPEYASRYPNRQTALVIGPSFYEHVEKFKDLRVGKRGEEYESLKKVWQDQLMRILVLEFPQLEGRIEFVELGTAVTNDFYLGNFRGAVYGLSHTPERFNQSFLAPKTKLPGLWLTGQDIVVNGISGAQASGLVTVGALMPSFLLRRAWKYV